MIENALLEKRLMHDLAVRDRKLIIHKLSILVAYYNRKLGHIMQEAVRVEREQAKLFTIILPVMNYHIYASFRISKDSYGNLLFKLGGTSQGSSVSGAIY